MNKNLPPVGTRIAVVRDQTAEAVFLYGFGVYEGEFPIDVENSSNDAVAAGRAEMGSAPLMCPRLRLDSGEIVWGAECWWGPEEAVKASFGVRNIVQCSISADRQAVRQAEVDRAEFEDKWYGRARQTLGGLADGPVAFLPGGAVMLKRDDGPAVVFVTCFVAFRADDGRALEGPELADLRGHMGTAFAAVGP